MSGETALSPRWKEALAENYALLIRKGERTFEEVPIYPLGLRDRVAYLISLE